MDLEQNNLKKRAIKIAKAIGWTLTFIIVREGVHFVNDGSIVPNWWIGLVGAFITMLVYLAPSNKFFLRKTRWFIFLLFGFFLSWFLSDLGEFIEMLQLLLENDF